MHRGETMVIRFSLKSEEEDRSSEANELNLFPQNRKETKRSIKMKETH